MKIRFKRVLILLLALFLMVSGAILIHGRYWANHKVTIKENTIEHEKISPVFDGFSFVYFSDVHFNEFVDQNRFDQLVDKINTLKPDVILFGGDLISEAFAENKSQQVFIESLKKLEAPYGKFAVLGEKETGVNTILTNVNNFFAKADFEVLQNQSTKLYYNSDEYINLIGLLDSSMRLSGDENYTIAFSHQPMLADSVSADLMIAGATHGGQINLPFFKDNFLDEQPYTKKTQLVNQMRLDVSNGVGTTVIDMRIFAPAQINYYVLYSKETS